MKTGGEESKTAVFFDTNLLILYIVGLVDRSIVVQKKHKKIDQFDVDLFDLLKDIASDSDVIFVTPHVLTETSNLLSFHADPEKSRLMNFFAQMLREGYFVEVYEPSIHYIENSINNFSFARLGLTDCAILELIAQNVTLFTEDLALYIEASMKGIKAENINHWLNY